MIFGLTELSGSTRNALTTFMEDKTEADRKARDAGMITLIVSSPDYQLA